MFGNIFKKKNVNNETKLEVKEEESFNPETKISVVENEGIAYVKVFSPMPFKELLMVDNDFWEKKYIYLDDIDKCFDRMVVNIDNVLYKYTIYSDGNIKLNKRVKHDNGVYEVSLTIDYGFYFSEMSHNIAGSTAPICFARINDDSYDVMNIKEHSHISENGVVPKEIFDVEKINDIINDFLDLNILEINDALNKALESKGKALLLKR